MRRITQLVWDKEILEKVERKHGLTSQEVDEACFNQDRLVLKEAKGSERLRYLVYSQTDAGRYILIVLEPMDKGKVRVITARDLEPSEERFYKERRK